MGDLKLFIEKNLSRFINSEIVPRFTTEDAMKVWTRAFTHFSASPAPNNYELLEKVGDKKADAVLVDIIKIKLPTAKNEEEYTILLNYYHSEEVFSRLGEEEGFDKYLIASRAVLDDKVAVKKINEDLFEAFVGALSEVGNVIGRQVYNARTGYNFVEQYLFYIFNPIEIDLIHASGAFKNQIQEIMKNLGVPLNRLVQNVNRSDVVVYFFVPTQIFRQVLEKLGRDPSKLEDRSRTAKLTTALSKQSKFTGDFILLGSAIASNSDEADRLSAREALEYLSDNFDINREVGRDLREELFEESKSPDMEFIEKYYTDIEFLDEKYGSKSYHYLVGTRHNKRENIAEHITSSGTNFATARKELIKVASERIKRRIERSERTERSRDG